MTSLSNLDLVDTDVLERYQTTARSYCTQYGLESAKEEENFPIDFSTIVPPIDRIRIGSCALNHVCTLRDSLVSSVCESEEPFIGFSLAGGNKIFFSNRSPILVGDEKFRIDKMSILNKDFVLVISGLQIRLINTRTLAIVAEHEIPPNDENTRNSVTCVEKLEISPQFKFVIATNDGAIYFVVVNFGQQIEVSHQLVIASNASTLGQIISLKKSRSFLAILSEKSLLILENLASDKPKIVMKISNLQAVVGYSYIAWFSGGIIVRIRDSNFFILEEFANSVFEQKHCFVRSDVSFDNIFISSENRTGFVESQTPSRSLTVFELEPHHNGWTMKLFPSIRHALPDCIVGQVLSDSLGQILTISATESNCDIHTVKLSSWSEVVNSLIYSQKFSEAVTIMEAVRRGLVVGKLDDFPPGIVEQIIQAGNEGKLDQEFFLKFMYYQRFFDYDISDNLLDRLVAMVATTDHLLDPSQLPSSLFQRLLGRLSDMKSPLLDPLIVRTIFHSCSKPNHTAFPIDLNSAIRIATVQDLRMSIIMIHVYLLKEFVFPVKYLMSSGVEPEELFFYIFSIFNGQVYPFWTGGESMYDMVAARAELGQYLVEEKGLNAIVKKFAQSNFSWKFFLNSLLFEQGFDLGENGPDCPNEEKDMFRIKSAVLDGSLDKYLSKRKDILEYFLSSKSLNSKLFVKVFNTVGLPGMHDRFRVQKTLDLLLVAPSLDRQVLVKLIDEKFVEPLGLSQLVEILTNKNRLDIALLLLENRRDFHRMCEILSNKVFDRKIFKVFQSITERSGELFDSADLVQVWSKIISSGFASDLDASDKWLAKVDSLEIIQNIHDLHVMDVLVKGLVQRRQLLKQCAKLYGIDVGTQFNELVRRKDRARGFQMMASICHVCLDPLLSKRAGGKRICSFTCGHIAHEECCDVPEPRQGVKRMIRCPACV